MMEIYGVGRGRDRERKMGGVKESDGGGEGGEIERRGGGESDGVWGGYNSDD